MILKDLVEGFPNHIGFAIIRAHGRDLCQEGLMTYPLGMPMDSRDLGAALPAGAMLGYGSHSPRFSGEAAKAAKAASAQGSLGFSGDSGRRGLYRIKIGSVLSAPGYPWHNLLEVGASTSAREKIPLVSQPTCP